MDTLTSSYSKQGQYSGVDKVVKSEIDLNFLFMVTDLVHIFQIICENETKVHEQKLNV